MNAKELAEFLLEHPDWPVFIRVDNLDDDEDFDIFDVEDRFVISYQFPEPESPEDTRMFL